MSDMAPLAMARERADLRIAIVGAGFAGIGMAVVLRRAGFTNVTIFEKAAGVGGTWRDNTYPGAACDVPSHLYSFSFAPKTDWPHRYSSQADILGYIEDVVDRFVLRDCIRLGLGVTEAHYDGEARVWHVHSSDGAVAAFDIFVPAVGQLSLPQIPAFAGLPAFKGAAFHAARWDHGVAMEGKRVAVVGAAASAVQIVPELAKICAQLSVYQRTPSWIIPRGNHGYGKRWQAAFRRFPALRRAVRNWLYGRQEFLFGAFRTGSRRNKLVTGMAKQHLARQVNDPDLRAKLTPTYTLGCKRLLVSDDYLPCFNQANVELVTSAITRFTPTGIRTADGQERAFDAVVFATGFDVRNCLSPVRITGRAGASLQELWAEGPFAYRGVAVPGFPNLFLLYGPNTNLGHNSIIFMLECQFDYIRQCVERIAVEGLAALEVREEACRAYNDTLHTQLGATVWATGCGSWYGQDGKITANWSGSSTAYWRQMRVPVAEDFAAAA